jgi:phospholipase/carboxylesterase
VIVRERPAEGKAEGALVLFHGRGADENDLFPLLDILDPKRRLHGYCPRGPLMLPPGGSHWYAVYEVGHPDPVTFAPSYAAAAVWLDSLPYSSIVLGGFSQGAVMAYALGLGLDRPRPDAIVAMSGFIPQTEAWEADLSPPLPPIAIAHGIYDPIISVEYARSAQRVLQDAGADLLYREYPVDHTIDPSFLVEVREWLAKVRLESGSDQKLESGSADTESGSNLS